ncbi:MAG TPA: CAP domain-containing protein [Patescibacteria group bacterium]|nr:CAP domain-containing protein [Patescibacteria group bacterium]
MNVKDFILHRRFGHGLFILGAFMLLIVLVVIAPLSSGKSMAFGVSDIVSLTNQARDQMGLPNLTTSSALMNAAQMKAEDMAKQHYFAHTAPDGTVAWDYFKKVSYAYSSAGENLAITNEDAQAVINGWLNSPAHRDNLLSDVYTDLGIGMASYGDYDGHKNTFVIVAFYGKSAAIQNSAAATSPAGTNVAFLPSFTNMPPALLVSVAACFMLIGGVIELKHIKQLHQSHKIA